MMAIVTLLSGLLLSSIFTFEQMSLKLVLGVVFIGAGILIVRNSLTAYLVFIFLYPLTPSVPVQVGLPDLNLHEFLFLCFAFWWSVTKIGKAQIFRQKALAGMIGLLILFSALSSYLALLRSHVLFSDVFVLRVVEKWIIFLPWSQLDSLSTLRFFLNLLEGVLFFFITLDIVNHRERVDQALRVLFASAVCVSLLGILQYAFEFRPLVAWTGQLIRIRVNSTFSDPNSFGTYISGALLIGIVQFLSAGVKTRWKYLLGCGPILLCLIFTASRAAWGATGLVLLLLLIFARYTGSFPMGVTGRASRAISMSVGMLLVLLLGGLIVAVSITTIGLVPPEQNRSLNVDSILTGRLSVWAAGVKIFYEHPFFGIGLGTFPQHLDRYQHMVPSLYLHENAHNYFLQLLTETGLIGFFLFFFIIALSIREGIRLIRTGPVPWESTAECALLSAILAFLITSLTGHPLLLVKLQFFFWGLLGMLWSLMPQRNISAARSGRVGRFVPAVVALAVLLLIPVEAYFIMQSRHVLPYEYGFYDWEKDQFGTFRWTGKNAQSLVTVEGKVFKIPLRQINANLVKTPESVQIFLNDQLLDTVTFTSTRWHVMKYYLLTSKPNDVVKIGVKPDAVFTPSEISDSPDSRNLGIAVGPFEWENEVVEPIGIYDREKQHDSSFVWTRMQASLPLGTTDSTLSVPLFYNNPHAKNSLKVLLYWNDTVVKETWIDNKGWKEVSLNLPSPQKGVLTLRAGKTWNPGKLGLNNDFRDLGVGIGEIQRKD